MGRSHPPFAPQHFSTRLLLRGVPNAGWPESWGEREGSNPAIRSVEAGGVSRRGGPLVLRHGLSTVPAVELTTAVGRQQGWRLESLRKIRRMRVGVSDTTKGGPDRSRGRPSFFGQL